MRVIISICILLLLIGAAGAASLAPVIANPGFEAVAPGNDASGWGWYTRADASFRSETADPHSGKRCMVFTNASPLAPEVYGRLAQGVGVLPSTKYELSVWVRGENVTEGIHFTDWKSYKLDIPSGTYGWRRVSTTFTVKNGEAGLNLGINVVNKCKILAIDDISLKPVGAPLKGKGVEGSFIAPGQVIGDNQTEPLGIFLTSSLKEGAAVQANIRSGKVVLLDKSETLKPGENSIEWEWNTSPKPLGMIELSIRVLDAGGKTVASASRKIEKVSPAGLMAKIDTIESKLKEFDLLAAKCRARKIPIDYPLTARTLLAQFIPLTRGDVRSGELRRAAHAVQDMNRSVAEAMDEMRACLRNPSLAPNARRYRTGKVTIDGMNFIGPRTDTRGKESRGPLFFCGYGHFSEARRDMAKWPGYGVNIIQSAEFGPSAVFPEENKIDLSAVRTLVNTLDNAARNNVRVDVLLSPHYFPDWVLKKYPDLLKGGGGFLGYTVDAPEAKHIVELFLRIVIPMIKDKPALHSLCLSNEPLFDRGATADNTKPLWMAYLTRVHGTVMTLNERYGTSYAKFEDIPIPGNASYGDPQFYDWCVFNQERFAGWHKWMANVIHEMAPGAPVHAKAMWITINWRYAVALGLDPELFSQLSDINGNDCTISPGDGEWGIGWSEQNMYFDLQRSMAKKPIFNSENHLQPDGSTYYVAPEHYRTALWQGAIHGQGSTTIWVWGRATPGNPSTGCFYGCVMDRPGCAQAVGTTCLDLNRFSERVAALQNVKAPVAILYSMASYAKYDGYLGALGRAYWALNFSGVKIDFISQKQLAAGKGRNYKMIVLPEAVNVPDSTFDALRKLPGSTRVVFIGNSLAKDPYGKDRSPDAVADLRARSLVLSATDDAEKVLWPRLRDELATLKALPPISVVDATSGKPIWGLEWLTASVGGRTVINLVNLRSKPMDVKLMRGGKEIEARNLLSLGGKARVRHLKPITPVLAE